MATAMLKSLLGDGIVAVAPQCDFTRCVFIIGHMRCGSTALSNILVSRPEFSGYGEAHIRYDSRAALGVLLLNQWRRGSWQRRAPRLFDKILHSRYDAAACPEFFGASAIFVARRPADTIPSIRHLFATLGGSEYRSDAEAAAYLGERLTTMLGLWERFAPARRLALTHDGLTGDPDAALARASAMLGLAPPLSNGYAARAASQAPGAGDPLQSHRFQRIEPAAAASSLPRERPPLEVSAAELARLDGLYRRFAALTAEAANSLD